MESGTLLGEVKNFGSPIDDRPHSRKSPERRDVGRTSWSARGVPAPLPREPEMPGQETRRGPGGPPHFPTRALSSLLLCAWRTSRTGWQTALQDGAYSPGYEFLVTQQFAAGPAA